MSVVLVVGPQSCGKRALVQALIQSLQPSGSPLASAGDSKPPPLPEASPSIENGSASSVTQHNQAPISPERQVTIEEADAAFDIYPLTINTKYYSAQVALWRQAQSVPILALRQVEIEGLAGIIVVFNLTEEGSLEQAMEWRAFVDAKEDVAFRVCVGSKVDLLPIESREAGGSIASGFGSGASVAEGEGKGLQERGKRCLEWCLDHGFEYVEADCRDAKKGGELREKEGVPRIVEALQSNVWSDMSFRTEHRPSGGAGATVLVPRIGASALGGEVGAVSGRVISPSDSAQDGAMVSEHLKGFVYMGDDGPHGAAPGLGYGTVDSDSDADADAEEMERRMKDAGYGNLDSDSDAEKNDTDTIYRAESRQEVAPLFGIQDNTLRQGRHFADMDKQQAAESDQKVDGDAGLASGIEISHVELQARWEGVLSESAAEGEEPTAPVYDSANSSVSTSAAEDKEQHIDGNVGVVAVKEASSDTRNADTTGLSEGSTVMHTGHGGAVENDSPEQPIEPGQGKSVVRGGVAEESGRREKGVNGDVGLDDDAVKSEERLLEAAGAAVGDLGADADEEEMDILMAEVRKARQEGTSLPDEQRRARAADVATRLAALLGDDDDGDSD